MHKRVVRQLGYAVPVVQAPDPAHASQGVPLGREGSCLEYSCLLKAGAMLFHMHGTIRKILEGGSEERGIAGKGLKLCERQPIEAEGIAYLI